MKKGSLIVNAVMIVAVVVLYVLFFTSPRKHSESEAGADTSAIEIAESGLIAYVNFDTVVQQYNMYSDLKDQLVGKQKSMEVQLNSKSKAYEKGVGDYQNKVSKGLITRAGAEDLERQLMQEQQGLIQLRDNLTQQLSEEEGVMNRQVLYSIIDYLKEFNKDKKYQFIFSNSIAGPMLYAQESYNITRDVLKGLNAKYNAEKEKPKK